MSGFTRRDLPADISVFAGDFVSQPLVFAHLLDVAPGLDLTHVEVIQSGHATRLAPYFEPSMVETLTRDAKTLVLILPAAFESADCPVPATEHLAPLGLFRGTIPHLSATP